MRRSRVLPSTLDRLNERAGDVCFTRNENEPEWNCFILVCAMISATSHMIPRTLRSPEKAC